MRQVGPQTAKTNGHRQLGRGRVLIYSHDTYGLGHLRRSILIAEGLAEARDAPSVLIATGSPHAQAFDLPPRCDTLKLPAVTKSKAGHYRPRRLKIPLDDLVQVRADLLRTVARSFAPDLILVDHSPVGMQRELWPLFDDLRRWSVRPALVLGLRDITDDANAVVREWHATGAWEAIERVYDRVLVYGDPVLRTTAQDLRLTERFANKLRLVGYLGRPIPATTPTKEELPSILVTAGGGGDGHRLLSGYVAFLERLHAPAEFRSILVTGPFLSRARHQEILVRCRALNHPVEVMSFTERFEDLLASAAGVVSMAGYNTVVEILSAGIPALLVPRRRPRREQWIRAERLAALDGESVSFIEDADPAQIARFVQRVVGRRDARQARLALRMDGLPTTVNELRDLLRQARQARQRFVAAGEGSRVAALA
jgi:predicted glycosyltransferase